jgi:hypothetical protein
LAAFDLGNVTLSSYVDIFMDYTLVIASTGTYRAARQAGYKLAINPKPMINPLAIIKSAVLLSIYFESFSVEGEQLFELEAVKSGTVDSMAVFGCLNE